MRFSERIPLVKSHKWNPHNPRILDWERNQHGIRYLASLPQSGTSVKEFLQWYKEKSAQVKYAQVKSAQSKDFELKKNQNGIQAKCS